MPQPLFILMRNDLDSLNPGKACAQAAHAANDFMMDMIILDGSTVYEPFKEWVGEGGTFGTTVVLGVSEYQLYDILNLANKCKGVFSNKILDSTYPIRDGKVVHHIPLVTCGWVFTGFSFNNFAPENHEHEFRILAKMMKTLELY